MHVHVGSLIPGIGIIENAALKRASEIARGRSAQSSKEWQKRGCQMDVVEIEAVNAASILGPYVGFGEHAHQSKSRC